MKRKVVIKQDEINPVPVEILAKSIVEISGAMKKINDTRLNRDTLITLLFRHCPTTSRSQIGEVLDGLTALERKCLK